MTFETSYYDAEPDESMAQPSYRPPWWNEVNKQCSCQDRKPFLANTHIGFSDSTFRQWKCPTCGRVWCDYLEG